MGLVSAVKAVQKFYAAPMQSKSSSKAICIFVFAIIVAVAIVIAYRHKGANKLFMKDGLIGRQFHNNAAWKAIVVSVASGLAVLGLTYTFIATGYHLKHKKKAEKSGEPMLSAGKPEASAGKPEASGEPMLSAGKPEASAGKPEASGEPMLSAGTPDGSNRPKLSDRIQKDNETMRVLQFSNGSYCDILLETHDTENSPLPENYELHDGDGKELPSGWFRIYNHNNKCYYYHPETDQSTWKSEDCT